MFDTLNSTTYIEANQSFVLGKGKHGSYKAKSSTKSESKAVGEYDMAKNKQVIFKDLGAKKAIIGTKLTGETSLSMNYQPDKP